MIMIDSTAWSSLLILRILFGKLFIAVAQFLRDSKRPDQV
jgi:hypothetical protein